LIREIKRLGKKKLNQFKLKRNRVHLKGNNLKKDLKNLGIDGLKKLILNKSLIIFFMQINKALIIKKN